MPDTSKSLTEENIALLLSRKNQLIKDLARDYLHFAKNARNNNPDDNQVADRIFGPSGGRLLKTLDEQKLTSIMEALSQSPDICAKIAPKLTASLKKLIPTAQNLPAHLTVFLDDVPTSSEPAQSESLEYWQEPGWEEAVLKGITVDYSKSGLAGSVVYHGTLESDLNNIKQGPKNLGKGLGGAGLYVDFNHKVAERFACIKGQFKLNETGFVLEGCLNPVKSYKIARIQLVRRGHESKIDYPKGFFPAEWAKNLRLQALIHEHFDILEVCAEDNVGYDVPSNRFFVIQERAGNDVISWSHEYPVFNKLDNLIKTDNPPKGRAQEHISETQPLKPFEVEGFVIHARTEDIARHISNAITFGESIDWGIPLVKKIMHAAKQAIQSGNLTITGISDKIPAWDELYASNPVGNTSIGRLWPPFDGKASILVSTSHPELISGTLVHECTHWFLELARSWQNKLFAQPALKHKPLLIEGLVTDWRVAKHMHGEEVEGIVQYIFNSAINYPQQQRLYEHISGATEALFVYGEEACGRVAPVFLRRLKEYFDFEIQNKKIHAKAVNTLKTGSPEGSKQFFKTYQSDTDSFLAPLMDKILTPKDFRVLKEHAALKNESSVKLITNQQRPILCLSYKPSMLWSDILPEGKKPCFTYINHLSVPMQIPVTTTPGTLPHLPTNLFEDTKAAASSKTPALPHHTHPEKPAASANPGNTNPPSIAPVNPPGTPPGTPPGNPPGNPERTGKAPAPKPDPSRLPVRRTPKVRGFLYESPGHGYFIYDNGRLGKVTWGLPPAPVHQETSTPSWNVPFFKILSETAKSGVFLYHAYKEYRYAWEHYDYLEEQNSVYVRVGATVLGGTANLGMDREIWKGLFMLSMPVASYLAIARFTAGMSDSPEKLFSEHPTDIFNRDLPGNSESNTSDIATQPSYVDLAAGADFYEAMNQRYAMIYIGHTANEWSHWLRNALYGWMDPWIDRLFNADNNSTAAASADKVQKSETTLLPDNNGQTNEPLSEQQPASQAPGNLNALVSGLQAINPNKNVGQAKDIISNTLHNPELPSLDGFKREMLPGFQHKPESSRQDYTGSQGISRPNALGSLLASLQNALYKTQTPAFNNGFSFRLLNDDSTGNLLDRAASSQPVSLLEGADAQNKSGDYYFEPHQHWTRQYGLPDETKRAPVKLPVGSQSKDIPTQNLAFNLNRDGTAVIQWSTVFGPGSSSHNKEQQTAGTGSIFSPQQGFEKGVGVLVTTYIEHFAKEYQNKGDAKHWEKVNGQIKAIFPFASCKEFNELMKLVDKWQLQPYDPKKDPALKNKNLNDRYVKQYIENKIQNDPALGKEAKDKLLNVIRVRLNNFWGTLEPLEAQFNNYCNDPHLKINGHHLCDETKVFIKKIILPGLERYGIRMSNMDAFVRYHENGIRLEGLNERFNTLCSDFYKKLISKEQFEDEKNRINKEYNTNTANLTKKSLFIQ